ncbi:MAG: hypothetical protein WCV55_02215 [Candidatus Paceibacterota bacterium]
MKREIRDIVPRGQFKSIRNIPLPEKERKERPQKKEDGVQIVIEETLEIPIRRIDTPTRAEGKAKERNQAIWFVAILSIIVLFFVVTSVLGKATITIGPKIVSFDVPQSVTAHKNPQNKEVGYSEVTLSISDSIFVKGSNQKPVSTMATGKIVLYNNTVSSQKLVSGTKLTTQDGLIFLLDKTVTIPARKISAGTTTPGSIAGSITASESGDKYNIGLGDLNILAFQGSPKFEQIFGRSKTPLAGGAEGIIAEVEKSLLDTSSQNLDQKIAKDLVTKVSKQLPEKFVIPEGAYTITFGSSTPVFNKDGATINITGTITAFALDAKSLLNNISANGGQKDSLGTDNVKILNSNIRSLSFTQTGDLLSISLNGNLTLETVIDGANIIKLASGLSKRDALIAIDAIPGVDSAEIAFNPIWKLKVPEDPSKIEVNIK